MTMIRILLVDDQQAVKTGLRMRLAREPDMTIVGAASDGAEALALAQALDPQVKIHETSRLKNGWHEWLLCYTEL
jgi:DNA-binding NarL/FixJ family response regulator